MQLAGKNKVDVGPMEKSEAHELLRTSLARHLIDNTKSATRLVDHLAYLPLAISQAVAFMNKNQITTASYLELYESDEDDIIYLLSQEFEDHARYNDIKNPIAVTWLISFRQILHMNPLAADYLRFMCFLPCRYNLDYLCHLHVWISEIENPHR